MEKTDANKKNHVIFEPIKEPRHLLELARKEKRELLQIPLFVIILATAVFSFYRTVSVIQAAEKSRKKIADIEGSHFLYDSEYDLENCELKRDEEVKLGGNDSIEILKCEQYLENICSVCGKTDGELELEKKAEREREIRTARENARAKQAAALARRRAAAPLPVSAIRVNGKLVCAKKNDKPSVSKGNNHGIHWDKECCLDPDEWPNPWCTY